MTTPFLVNHLWQSSCFALLAGLLAVALRKNSPKVRYWVWLSASLKFLVPFALLVSLGSVVPRPARHQVSLAVPVFPNTLVQIAEPFSPTLRATAPARAPLDWAPIVIGVVWSLGFLAIALARCRSWLGVRAALRAGTPIDLPIPVRALITPGAEEPGIVGFRRPVLVLPAQLLEHLNPGQLRAILTHELCHVRRRDNFFAAVHMVVEAIFWFHPLVWWIGSRMVEDRELACDEEVLRMGCEPADYVEGILKVCRFYLESPLPCISGVTGADVKKRLRAILAGSIAHELSGAKKMALATMGLAALAAPVLIGVLNAPAIRAQNAPAATPKFEVVSVKPCTPSGRGGISGDASPGRLTTECAPLVNEDHLGLIQQAYVRFAGGHSNPVGVLAIEGGPAWIHSERFTVDAKAEGRPSLQMMEGPMMQAVLEDRFHLKIHRETREGPVYVLTLPKGAAKLKPFQPGSCTPIPSERPLPPLPTGQQYCRLVISPQSLDAQGSSLTEAAGLLSLILDRPVIDRTGMAGSFEIHLEFSPDPLGPRITYFASPMTPKDLTAARPAAPDDPTRPTVFQAVEQLGLKLAAARGPIEVLVIDHVERPSEN